MHTRLVSFTGAKDIDGGIAFIRDKVMPILSQQAGYRGLTVSADRAAGALGALSLWETEADRDASDSAMGKTREEGHGIIGGELTVEVFEQLVAEVERPGRPGHRLGRPGRLKQAAAAAQARRQQGIARNVTFGEVGLREIVVADLK
jgi:hypothetical protein